MTLQPALRSLQSVIMCSHCRLASQSQRRQAQQVRLMMLQLLLYAKVRKCRSGLSKMLVKPLISNFLVNFCPSLLTTHGLKMHVSPCLKCKIFCSSSLHFRLVHFAHPLFRIFTYWTYPSVATIDVYCFLDLRVIVVDVHVLTSVETSYDSRFIDLSLICGAEHFHLI